MQTTLEYIDTAMDVAVAARADNIAVPDQEREKIKAKSVRTISGFEVFDEEKERDLLDKALAKRRKAIDKFCDDRTVMRQKLDEAGIAPLAILPTSAWARICEATELFRLMPNSHNQVEIAIDAFEGLEKPKKAGRWKDKDPLEIFVESKWNALLKRFWPDGVARMSFDKKQAQRWHVMGIERPMTVTLVLPSPPADVVKTLIKADKASIPMVTAAVADAICFKEDVYSLRDRNAKHRAAEQKRIADWLADPIVYSEHETATAIIAQFGDFPVEKEVVDRVIEADDFIPDMPSKTHPVNYGKPDMTDIDRQYLEAMRDVQNMNSQRLRQQQSMWDYRNAVIGSSHGPATTPVFRMEAKEPAHT